MSEGEKIFIIGILVFFFMSVAIMAWVETKRDKSYNIARVIDVLELVESSGGKNLDHAGDELGILGITPIMVREVNRILGEEVYTNTDRASRFKSRAMCNIFLQHQVELYLKSSGMMPTEYMLASSWNTGSIFYPVRHWYVVRYIEEGKKLI